MDLGPWLAHCNSHLALRAESQLLPVVTVVAIGWMSEQSESSHRTTRVKCMSIYCWLCRLPFQSNSSKGQRSKVVTQPMLYLAFREGGGVVWMGVGDVMSLQIIPYKASYLVTWNLTQRQPRRWHQSGSQYIKSQVKSSLNVVPHLSDCFMGVSLGLWNTFSAQFDYWVYVEEVVLIWLLMFCTV